MDNRPVNRVVQGVHSFESFGTWLTALQDRSPRTADAYTSHVRMFTRFVTERSEPHVKQSTIEQYLISQAQLGRSASTRRITVCALRAWFTFLQSTQDFPDNPAAAVKTPKVPRQRMSDYSPDELERLLTAPLDVAKRAKSEGNMPRWLRARVDHMLIASYRYTGARQSELLNLTFDQLDLNHRIVTIEGKGAKQRPVPIPDVLGAMLDDYLTRIRPQCPQSPFLFANPDGYAQTAAHGRYAPRACLNAIGRYGTYARIAGWHHPHRIRHSYATDLLRRGVSLEVLRQLLGHESLTVTQRYLHLRTDDLQAAIGEAFGTVST